MINSDLIRVLNLCIIDLVGPNGIGIDPLTMFVQVFCVCFRMLNM